ncbi:MAG: hypothetical protein AB7V45_03350 [Candidatus Krumholzibacteriia bacterium]
MPIHRFTWFGCLLVAAGFLLCGGVSTAQYLDCNTVPATPDSLLLNQQAPAYQTTLDSAWIGIFIHVLSEAGDL